MQVRDWMTKDPITVTPQTSVLNARRLLNRYGIRHLPVVDEENHVVGMVSARDLAIGDSRVAASLSALQSDLVTGRYRPVESVMTSPAIVTLATEPVATAARLMLTWSIGALPVVEDGCLVGIITTGDCLRALVFSEDADDLDEIPVTLVEDEPPHPAERVR